MYMIAPILALFCAIGTKCKVTVKIAITKRKIHLFFTENKKRVIFTNFREKSANPARGQTAPTSEHAMGTGTWQLTLAFGFCCQVPVPWQESPIFLGNW
jgi:hypothetical protein